MVGMLEHPDLEIAGLALEFWGMLGELLAEMACAEGGRGPRSPPLEESVRHACGVAMVRARYPPSSGGAAGNLEEMDGDDRDELEVFREQVHSAPWGAGGGAGGILRFGVYRVPPRRSLLPFVGSL